NPPTEEEELEIDDLGDEGIPNVGDDIPPAEEEELDLGGDGVNPPAEEEEESSSLNYKNVVSKLVAANILDGIDAFETEEGEQIPFDEAEIDEEMFSEIIKQKIQEVGDKAKEGRVSTDGISEFTQKLIEIEKNGGDVQQALESYQTFKNPLEGLDLSNVSDQQAVLALKYQSKGLEDAEIISIIKKFQDEGTLEDKALEAKTQIETAFNKQLDAINEQAKNRKKQQEEALKLYRDDLGNELKQFELNDSYKKKLLDLATKPDKAGKFELDNLYSELRKDPVKAAELVLFLTNKEEYIKQLTEKDRREDKLGTMKTIKFVKKGKGSDVKIKGQEQRVNNKNFIDLEEIIN
ncbi:MAG: hypothetical protein KC414_03835, partial [Romboutsia sp.]|nr:hypothetical protein [Romboutsia sp.]